MAKSLRDIINDEQACLNYIYTGIIEADRREARRDRMFVIAVVAVLMIVIPVGIGIYLI